MVHCQIVLASYGYTIFLFTFFKHLRDVNTVGQKIGENKLLPFFEDFFRDVQKKNRLLAYKNILHKLAYYKKLKERRRKKNFIIGVLLAVGIISKLEFKDNNCSLNDKKENIQNFDEKMLWICDFKFF